MQEWQKEGKVKGIGGGRGWHKEGEGVVV